MSLIHEPGSRAAFPPEPRPHPAEPVPLERSAPTPAALRVLGLTVFALAPWLTLGLGSPVIFLVAALRFGRRGKRLGLLLWLSTALYAASVITMVATSDAAAGSVADQAFNGSVLISIVLAGVESLVVALLIALRAGSGIAGRVPLADGQVPLADGQVPSSRSHARRRGERVPRPRARTRRTRPQLQHPRALLALGVVAAVIGATAGLLLWRDAADFGAHSAAVDGVVIKVREESDPQDSGMIYRITIRYQPAGAGVQTLLVTRDDRLPLGRHLTVHYDRRNPGDARTDNGGDESLGAGLCAGTGLLILAVVLIVLARGRAFRRAGAGPDPTLAREPPARMS